MVYYADDGVCTLSSAARRNWPENFPNDYRKVNADAGDIGFFRRRVRRTYPEGQTTVAVPVTPRQTPLQDPRVITTKIIGKIDESIQKKNKK